MGKPRRFYGEVNDMCTSTNNHMIFVHTRLQKKKPKKERKKRR